jgi:hypothetical protein
MALVLRKASQPRESLSRDRLALVERYMIDAEEAEARARAAAEAAVTREAETRAHRTLEEELRREAQRARREAEAPRPDPEELLPPRSAAPRAMVEIEPAEQAQPALERPMPTAKQEARRRKALAKAERHAAKEAARLAVAAEKKEARERKALAKAAAKRRSRELKARAKIAR